MLCRWYCSTICHNSFLFWCVKCVQCEKNGNNNNNNNNNNNDKNTKKNYSNNNCNNNNNNNHHDDNKQQQQPPPPQQRVIFIFFSYWPIKKWSQCIPLGSLSIDFQDAYHRSRRVEMVKIYHRLLNRPEVPVLSVTFWKLRVWYEEKKNIIIHWENW